MVSIEGLDKAEVLSALHGSSRSQGTGALFDRGPLSVDECRAELGRRGYPAYNNSDLYFDYLRGRVMKVDLSTDQFNPALYDRDNGPGAAERAISRLHEKAPA